MYQETYQMYREAVETYLQKLFLSDAPYHELQEAMRYSLLAGGKRIRPVLTLAFADLFGGDWHTALPLGCALELIHTYSLIHDDLPCMDDDDLRRGKPTCHKVYGETMAVLAGDALQPEAFALAAAAPGLTDSQRVDAVGVLARACGADGMVAGQVLDIQGLDRTEEELRLLHGLKTGALMEGAAELGCIAAGAGERERAAARTYAGNLGLAFQIRDDVLDLVADEAELGKPVGSDQAAGKRTFVDLMGLPACNQLVEAYTAAAREAVAPWPGNEFLTALADTLAERKK